MGYKSMSYFIDSPHPNLSRGEGAFATLSHQRKFFTIREREAKISVLMPSRDSACCMILAVAELNFLHLLPISENVKITGIFGIQIRKGPVVSLGNPFIFGYFDVYSSDRFH
jgi:hypothetical protein